MVHPKSNGTFENVDAFAVRAHYENRASELVAYFFDEEEARRYSEQCRDIDAGTVEPCNVEVVWRYSEAVILGPSIRGGSTASRKAISRPVLKKSQQGPVTKRDVR